MTRPRNILVPALLTLGFAALLWFLIIHTEPELSAFGSREPTASELRLAAVLDPVHRLLKLPILPVALLLARPEGPRAALLFYGLAALFWGCVPYFVIRWRLRQSAPHRARSLFR